MDLIQKYFPELTDLQRAQFAMLPALYAEWNEKINVVSRKDIDNLMERHVLHSLSIARFISCRNATKIMDLGTGGGFPGIPLAIMFPECRFHLVDSIAKKLRVVEEVKEATGLKNIFTFHSRAEQMPYKYDFIVTRAVAPLGDLKKWTRGLYLPKSQNEIPNGLIALKGGNLDEEINEAQIGLLKKLPLTKFYSEAFFEDKYLIYAKLW